MNDLSDRFCAGCGGPLEDQHGVQAAPPQTPAYPPQTPAYPPQTPAYQPQTPAYQPQTPAYPPQTPAYPPQTPAYPPQTPAYPPQTPAYQPQTPAYQPQTPAYPPQTPAYQPQTPAYPPQGAAYQPQAAAYQPQTPGYPPQQFPQPMAYPAAPPKKKGWVKWVSIITGVLVVILGGLRLVGLFSDSGSATVETVASGSFGAQPEFYDSVGRFFAMGQGTTATFYAFDQKGAAQRLASVQDGSAGKLLGVSVGDMYNNGNAVMVAYFEKKLYIAGQTGKAESINAPVKNVLIGDYDGDGKNETIFVDKDKEGKDEYQYWRFSANQNDSKELIALGGRTAPILFNAKVRIGKQDYLLGYTQTDGLQAVVYKWDSVAGPQPFRKYPIKDSQDAPAEWLAAGELGQGQSILISYGGSKPAVEVRVLNKDASEAKSLGSFAADGQGSPAVSIGTFTGKDPEILAVDKQGKYYIYHLK